MSHLKTMSKRITALAILALLFSPFAGLRANEQFLFSVEPTIKNITQSTAEVAWSTNNLNSLGLVKYKTSSENYYHYAYSSFASTHNVILRNLIPNTQYSYIVESDYLTESDEREFITKSGSFQTLAVTGDTATYAWSSGDWSTCLNNTQSRTVLCKKTEGASVTTVGDSYCTGTKPATTQSCITTVDSPVISNFSISYNSSNRMLSVYADYSRPVTSYVYIDGTIILTSNDVANDRGSINVDLSGAGSIGDHYVYIKVCDYQNRCTSTKNNKFTILAPATYAWSLGDWSTCFNNTQSRTVLCKKTEGASVTTVGDSYCTGTKPATTQSCTSVTYAWSSGDWSTCLNNTQSRTVLCKKTEGASVTTVGDSYCTGTKPATTQSCTVDVVEVTLTATPTTVAVGQKVILTGKITGDIVVTRVDFKVSKTFPAEDVVLCSLASGVQSITANKEYKCEWTPTITGTFPLTLRINSTYSSNSLNYTVTSGTITPTYAWSLGNWSSCVNGIQTRKVECTYGAMGVVWDSLCNGPKPATTQSCTSITYAWSSSDWSACLNSTQSRTVLCKKTEGASVTTVGDSYCTSTKPATSQSCTSDTKELKIYEEDIKALPDNSSKYIRQIYWSTNKQANCNVAYGKTNILLNTNNEGNKISGFGTLIQPGSSANDGKYSYYKTIDITDELYYKIFCIDNSGVTKNSGVYPFAMPDLIVQGIVFSLPNPQVNQDVDITITYKNEGTVAITDNFNARLDFGQSRGKFVFKNNAFPRTSGAYPSISDPLEPGESFGETYTGYFTATGEMVLSVTVDAENKIAESNENNNSLTKTITVGQPETVIPIIKSVRTSGIGSGSLSILWSANGNYNCSVAYSKNADLSQGTSLLYTNSVISSEVGYWEYWVNVNNLIPATKYYYKVICAASEDNYSESSVNNFTTNSASDTLEISALQVGDISNTTAVVFFSTNFGAKGSVWYGTIDTIDGRNFRAYEGGSHEQYLSMVAGNSHEINLSSLLPNTTYYYRVSAVGNGEEIKESVSYSFKTLSSTSQYVWSADIWSDCVNGEQTRTVVCKTTAGLSVSENLCPGSKPALSQTCYPVDISDEETGLRLSGRLLLAVEDHGRVYYVNPDNHKKYEVTFGNVMKLFQDLSLGISNGDLNKILINPNSVSADKDSDGDGYNDKQEATYGYNPYLASNPNNRGNDKVLVNTTLSNRLVGKLLLQVEDRGRIWYVDQAAKRWEVTWENVMNLFTSLSLGISNEDLLQIADGN